VSSVVHDDFYLRLDTYAESFIFNTTIFLVLVVEAVVCLPTHFTKNAIETVNIYGTAARIGNCSSKMAA